MSAKFDGMPLEQRAVNDIIKEEMEKIRVLDEVLDAGEMGEDESRFMNYVSDATQRTAADEAVLLLRPRTAAARVARHHVAQ